MILSPPAIVFHFSPVVHNDDAGKDDDGDDEIITFYVEGKVRLVPKHQAQRGTPEQSKHWCNTTINITITIITTITITISSQSILCSSSPMHCSGSSMSSPLHKHPHHTNTSVSC